MEFGAAIVAAGIGYVLADGLDRFLATYNPAKPPPADKFTSSGVGTLANTLNIASTPHWQRLAAVAGSTVAPAVASMYVRSPMLKSSLEGAAIGSGVKLFSLLWNNVVMPMLKPKSPTDMQASIVARLYPAEISAKMNLDSQQTAVPTGTAFGALSGADVGPFALATAGDTLMPSAADALRRAAGMAGPGGDFPTLQNTWGTGMQSTPGVPPGVATFPTTAQAMHGRGHVGAGPDPSGPSYMPGPPPLPGPGPNGASPHDSTCGCGDKDPFLGFAGFLGDTEDKDVLRVA